jgi:hypothetical protein
MSFIKETSDSSRFYRPTSAAGSSDISTTSLPGLLSDMARVRPELELRFQTVEPVYLRPKLIATQATTDVFATSCDWP